MDFMYNILGNTLDNYSTGRYINQIVVTTDDFKVTSIGLTPEITDKLGVNSGDYVLVTPMYGLADISFMACFKVECIEFNDDSQIAAIINTKVAQKFIENNWDGVSISIFTIKPDKVASAFDLFSILRFFRQGEANANDAEPIDIPFKLLSCTLEQTVSQTINIPNNTNYFTMVTYLCPICHNNMAKLLINPMTLNDNGRTDTYDRIFTCCNCNTIIAPTRGQNLSVGTFNFVQLDDNSYQNVIQYFDRNARL